MASNLSNITLKRLPDYWQAGFTAMANPCEVLIAAATESLAQTIAHCVATEAWRIEHKFSRYRTDSVTTHINHSAGQSLTVDEETTQLLQFGAALTALSAGAFDLTSGALRRIWRFTPQAQPPTTEQIQTIMQYVGWQHVTWQPPNLTLPTGMELDFGGIGKEYAVDRAIQQLYTWPTTPVLVNFGGDLRSAGPPPPMGTWQVGIEATDNPQQACRLIQLSHGALATSGVTHRHLLHEGQVYGHILDARTGWPVTHAPRSVTVAADTCSQAGALTTLAMLKGQQAEAFLAAEQVTHWCLR